MQADLAPGQTLSIRLNGPVYSEHSRTGDPVEGTVTYPLCKDGENITCPAGQLVVPPGTKVEATVLFAQKASSKYSRPRLVLDFSNIVHANGTRSPLYARVIDVDNARETVRNNEIIGIIQPHASTKAGLVLAGPRYGSTPSPATPSKAPPPSMASRFVAKFSSPPAPIFRCRSSAPPC